MAISIKNEGVINPIEIDKDHIIITGEMRWRAAKLAGLEKVLCKIMEIDDSKRFIRQMQENLHHNTMSAWDTAKGYEETAKILSMSPGDIDRDSKHKSDHFKKMTVELSELYGTPHNTISEYLSLLSEPLHVQKALKEEKVKRTKIREANKVPEVFKEKLKKKIIDDPSISRDAVSYIAKGLKRAEKNGELGKGEEVLSANYKDLTSIEVIKKVDKIYPTGIEVLEKSGDRMNKMLKMTNEMGAYFKKNPLISFASFDAQNLRVQLSAFKIIIDEYLVEKK